MFIQFPPSLLFRFSINGWGWELEISQITSHSISKHNLSFLLILFYSYVNWFDPSITKEGLWWWWRFLLFLVSQRASHAPWRKHWCLQTCSWEEWLRSPSLLRLCQGRLRSSRYFSMWFSFVWILHLFSSILSVLF